MSALNKCLELEANAIKIAAKRLSNQQVEKSLELINRWDLPRNSLGYSDR